MERNFLINYSFFTIIITNAPAFQLGMKDYLF